MIANRRLILPPDPHKWRRPGVARAFDRTAPADYLFQSNGSPVSSTPLTMSCWAKATADFGAALFACGLSTGANNRDQYLLWFAGSNDRPSLMRGNATITDYLNPDANTMLVNVWTHIGAVCPADNEAYIFCNGIRYGPNTTSVEVTSWDSTSLAAQPGTNKAAPMTCELAECVVWDVALGDPEMWYLAQHGNPWNIRRGNIQAFYLPWGDYSDRDHSGKGLHLTAYNNPWWEQPDDYSVPEPEWYVPFGFSPPAAGGDSLAALFGRERQRRFHPLLVR